MEGVKRRHNQGSKALKGHKHDFKPNHISFQMRCSGCFVTKHEITGKIFKPIN